MAQGFLPQSSSNDYSKDKSWMQLRDRLGIDYKEYAKGMKFFIKFARGSVDTQDFIRCPYKKCKNLSSYNLGVVEEKILSPNTF